MNPPFTLSLIITVVAIATSCDSAFGATAPQAIKPQASAGPPRAGVRRMVNIDTPKIASKDILRVDEPISYSCDKQEKKNCKVPITVYIDRSDATGKTCSWNYPDVVITKHPNQEITWALTELGPSVNARFTTLSTNQTGGSIDGGIHIYRKGRESHFKNKQRIDNQTFFWERDHAAKDDAQVFFYDIYVDHDFGTVKRCDVPDPIIVNRD